MYKYLLACGMALMMVLVATNPPGQAAPQPQAQSIITYPTNGMTISGVVEVTGIATHANMRSYQLRYAAGPQPTADSQWVDFAIVEGTAVQNDVLGTWDTTTVPDGQYTLALAVWGVDDGPYVFFVTNLTVNNTQPVESPTATAEPSPTPEPLPTEVPVTPTPVVIEQPPTPTARPSPTSQSGAIEETAAPGGGEEGDGFDLPVNFSELGTAFYTGGLITVLLFSVWGFYLLVKAGVRWLWRQRASSLDE
ncbi:MAG: hypothetical protein DRI48_05815 [Chloroflexi bacterium]|nr:MAG: hypothetical protein DRI48_05815 [Chloroflexota bacterium]